MLFVGYAEAGKTTLLNLVHTLKTKVNLNGTNCQAELCGPDLVFAVDPEKKLQLNKNWKISIANTSLLLSSPYYATTYTLKDGANNSAFLERIRHLVHSRQTDPTLATHGIDVRSFKLTGKEPQAKSVDIVAWDFAGQKEYYNMHDQFVSDQAVYLLVWDVTKEGDKKATSALMDWFRMLRVNLPPPNSMYSNTTIIVVGTHIDLLPLDQRSDAARNIRDNYVRRIAKKAGFTWSLKIEEICATNARESRDIAKLIETIYKEALTRAGKGKIVAAQFRIVEKKIARLRNRPKILSGEQWPVVSMSKLGLNDVDQSTTIETTLKILGEEGDIVCVPRSNEIVLSPSFLTQIVMGDLARWSNTNPDKGCLELCDFEEMWPKRSEDERPKLIALLEQFDVCFRTIDRFSGTEVYVINMLLSKGDVANQLKAWHDAANRNKDDPVDLSRLYYFDVVPPFLVARVISKLNKTRKYQDGIWKNGALLHDEERHSVGLLLLDQEDEHIEGTLMVRAQSSRQLAALKLLDHICDVVQECLERSPGVTPHDLLDCRDCQPDCRQRLHQIAADAATIDIVSVEKEPKIRCTRHHLNEYLPRTILEKSGHVTPYSENVPSAMLPYSDYVLQVIRDAKLDNVAKEQLASSYPYVFLPVPSKDPKEWYSAFTNDQLFLLPLCEFSYGDPDQFHPVQGVQPQQLTGESKDIPRDLWKSMRIASPLPELKKEEIKNKFKIENTDTQEQQHWKNFIKIYHREIQEHGLSGKNTAPRLAENALRTVQELFGNHIVL